MEPLRSGLLSDSRNVRGRRDDAFNELNREAAALDTSYFPPAFDTQLRRPDTVFIPTKQPLSLLPKPAAPAPGVTKTTATPTRTPVPAPAQSARTNPAPAFDPAAPETQVFTRQGFTEAAETTDPESGPNWILIGGVVTFTVLGLYLYFRK